MNRWGITERGVPWDRENDNEAEGEGGHLSLGEHLLEETQHLWYIQLDIFEVKEMFVVLLLEKNRDINAGVRRQYHVNRPSPTNRRY